MQRTSNSTSWRSIVSGLLGTVFILAAPATSVALSAKASTTTTTKTSAFCSNISTEANTVTTKLNGLISTAQQAWSNRDTKWNNLITTVNQEVAAARLRADTAREQDFTKLMAKATTSSENSAVMAYESSVNQAVSSRRTAYDAARQTYRSGVEAVTATRENTVIDQFNTFKTAVNSAIQTAEASCTATPGNGPVIHSVFQSSMQSARQTFSSERQSDPTINTQVKQLATTRDAAFNTADQTFQTAMNSAAQTLKEAFGSKSGSV